MKRCAWIQQELSENPQMKDWLHDRCSVEWAMGEIISSGQLQTLTPGLLNGFGRYALASFAAGTVQLYENLSIGAKNRLRGQLVDGLQTDKGLLSLQHEISTLVHLVHVGFDVEAHDLESGGGFDFLARRGELEIEVECKLFSADIGRKIHRRHSAKLFKVLMPTIQKVFRDVNHGLLIRITLPDRLTGSPNQHQEISVALQASLLTNGSDTSQQHKVSLYDFDIARSPFIAASFQEIKREKVIEFIASLTGYKNSTLMMIIAPSKGAVIVTLESAKSDAVLEGIRRQLRDAAVDQLTGERPGCLVAQLSDLTTEQLLKLASTDSSVRQGASGLQVMTSDLLQEPSRKHVHSVVYKAQTQATDFAGAITERGPTYVFKNAWHPLAEDIRYSIFDTK